MQAPTKLTLVSVTLLLFLVASIAADNDNNSQPSLIDAPSLKLHVTLKREAMQIHGQLEFNAFANPVVSTDNKLLYDGVTTFSSDETQFQYLLANGVSYAVEKPANEISTTANETARCHPASLPFDSILPALNNITPIPSATVGNESVKCANGNLFKTTFQGTNFVVCASGRSGFSIFGSDMTVQVEFLNSPVNISTPTFTKPPACSPVAKPTSLTPTALALLTGGEFPTTSSRNLKAQEHMAIAASSCECQSTPRPCVFFHGIGVSKEETELQDEPTARMGSIGDHAPCCSTVKYAHLNTMDSAWTDDTLQQKFCDFSLSLSETSDKTAKVVHDTIVVTHSMAGAVMAGALAKGKCSFDASTSWVALSSPMKGSMVAVTAKEFCDGDHGGELVKDVLDLVGQCPLPPSRLALTYEGEKFASAELNAAYVAAQEAYSGNVTAAICSNNYAGVVSIYYGWFIMCGKAFPHKSPENDGMVEFQSCSQGLDASLFGDSYTDRFYKAELNHADTGLLTSDGWFNDAKKPFKWFECLFYGLASIRLSDAVEDNTYGRTVKLIGNVPFAMQAHTIPVGKEQKAVKAIENGALTPTY